MSKMFGGKELEKKTNIQLCKVVKLFPCIYDPYNYDFHNKSIVNSSWERIADVVGMSDELCKEHWEDLKQRFINHRNTEKKKKQRNSYYLLEHIDFIEDFLKTEGSKLVNKPIDTVLVMNITKLNETTPKVDNSKVYVCNIRNNAEKSKNDTVSQDVGKPAIGAEVASTDPTSNNSTLPQSENASDGTEYHSFASENNINNNISAQSAVPPDVGNKSSGEEEMASNIPSEIDPSTSTTLVPTYMHQVNCSTQSIAMDKQQHEFYFLLDLLPDVLAMNRPQRRTFKIEVLKLIENILGRNATN